MCRIVDVFALGVLYREWTQIHADDMIEFGCNAFGLPSSLAMANAICCRQLLLGLSLSHAFKSEANPWFASLVFFAVAIYAA